MKPWPEALRRYLPKEADFFRPWWKGLTRSDGVVVESSFREGGLCIGVAAINPPFKLYRELCWRLPRGCEWLFQGAGWSADRVRAKVDADRPLPRPAFGPGQVWAWQEPDGTWRVRMDDALLAGVEDLAPTFVPPADAWLVLDLVEPKNAPWAPT